MDNCCNFAAKEGAAMKIIIVGCGKIGKSMIASLSAEGHDITIVDNNPMVLNETADAFDVIGVCGVPPFEADMGTHLHFEVWDGTSPVNPEEIFE